MDAQFMSSGLDREATGADLGQEMANQGGWQAMRQLWFFIRRG
jgi:hypothetical protein